MQQYLKDPSWKKVLKHEFEQPYMKELTLFLEQEAESKTILPKKELWFSALNSTPLDEVKVVILGQDPYPTKGHAHGLCFSALPEVSPLPKSLLNIYKELQSDQNIDNMHTPHLQPWAEQGVLLLNAVLTVTEGEANSHKNQGWERFTDKIIEIVNENSTHVVFVLWGTYAQKKGKKIDAKKHLILNDPHPSPLSAYRGFWDSKPFSKTNSYLREQGKQEINWQL